MITAGCNLFEATSRHVASLRADLTLMILYWACIVVGNVCDNSVDSYRLHASETQLLSYVADATPMLSVWSCYGTAVSQSRADLQHTLATQRLRYRLV